MVNYVVHIEKTMLIHFIWYRCSSFLFSFNVQQALISDFLLPFELVAILFLLLRSIWVIKTDSVFIQNLDRVQNRSENISRCSPSSLVVNDIA